MEMPNTKITERKHVVNSDSVAVCPRCQETMHKNSLKRHLFNVHREHTDGQRVTDSEYAAKAKQSKSSSQSSSSHTLTSAAASSVVGGASAAAAGLPELSNADVNQVFASVRAASTNAPGRESEGPPATVTVLDDSDVEPQSDEPTSHSASATLAAATSEKTKGEQSLVPRKDLTRVAHSSWGQDMQRLHGIPAPGNSDMWLLSRRFRRVSPTELVTAMAATRDWSEVRKTDIRRRISAMRYARDATLNELRRLLPHPSDSTPAAAVLFLNRVANLIRDEDDNPPLDPFE